MTSRSPLQGRVAAVFEKFAAGQTSDLHPDDLVEADRFWAGLGMLHEPQPPVVVKPRGWRALIRDQRARAALIVALMLPLSAVFWNGNPLLQGQTIESAHAERRDAELDDGSRIALDADSEVVSAYNGSERRVRLVRGEARFKVVSDTSNPFVVETPRGTVTAVGTEFLVRLNPSSVTVTVIEGVVKVEPRNSGAKQARFANAGDRLSFGPIDASGNEGFLGAPQQVAAVDASVWRDGYLYFRGETLEEAVAISNRHSRQQVRLTDAGLAKLPVYAVVRADDPEGIRLLIRELEQQG